MAYKMRQAENLRTKDHCYILQPPMRQLNPWPSIMNHAPCCIILELLFLNYFLFLSIFSDFWILKITTELMVLKAKQAFVRSLCDL